MSCRDEFGMLGMDGVDVRIRKKLAWFKRVVFVTVTLKPAD